MAQLLFDKKLKKYILYSEEGINCDICKKELIKEHPVFVHRSFNSKLSMIKKNFLCSDCVSKSKKFCHNSFVICELSNDFSKDCIIVSDDLSLKPSRNLDEASCEIIDRTKYARRELFEGAVIGADVSNILEKKDKELSLKELDNELLAIMNSKILGDEIESKEKKEIEHDDSAN